MAGSPGLEEVPPSSGPGPIRMKSTFWSTRTRRIRSNRVMTAWRGPLTRSLKLLGKLQVLLELDEALLDGQLQVLRDQGAVHILLVVLDHRVTGDAEVFDVHGNLRWSLRSRPGDSINPILGWLEEVPPSSGPGWAGLGLDGCHPLGGWMGATLLG
jgi:hypothetical protein